MNRIAITGMGIVSSIGNNVEAFKEGLKQGKCGIRKVEYPFINECLCGKIVDFNMEELIERYQESLPDISNIIKQNKRRWSNSMRFTVAAAMEAWQDASMNIVNKERTGCIIAGNNLTNNLQYDQYDSFKKNPEFFKPSFLLQFMDTNYLGMITEVFGIHGEGFTVGGTSASGNIAIINACRLIEQGVVDACVVVGVCAELSPMEIQGYLQLGGMGGNTFKDQPGLACRPFDEKHEGFIYGQSSACIVLESEKVAKERREKVYAYIRGGSIVLDGNHLPNPDLSGEKRAMKQAIEVAGLEVKDIDYINAHGTSTPKGDITELTAIRELFGEHIGNIKVNSTKGITGHCLYSAGIVEAIACVLQMQEGFVHGNRNLETPIELSEVLCKENMEKYNIQSAISNSFAFAGINTSIVLEKNLIH